MIIAVDAGSPGTVEAEHLCHELLGLLPDAEIACTHWVPATPTDHLSDDVLPAHVAVSITLPEATKATVRRLRHRADEEDLGLVISWPGTTAAGATTTLGPAQLVAGARLASAEGSPRTAGRLFRFPGQSAARGRLTARDLRDRAGIDVIEGIGGTPVHDDSVIDTMNFIRPIWRSAQSVLLVQPAANDVLVPFELEHQQKCCSNH
ncbi:hypothetical protein OG394_26950 [Kribbella sp. NBC_01245]|uniref:hypothetical protein n=1 Tax=Kribbella sp. NBC_01245 TaxID=2903578 RepID=UPI002E2A6D17|nr:hypothetical protein [Kribbella sp. NBC_01245]